MHSASPPLDSETNNHLGMVKRLATKWNSMGLPDYSRITMYQCGEIMKGTYTVHMNKHVSIIFSPYSTLCPMFYYLSKLYMYMYLEMLNIHVIIYMHTPSEYITLVNLLC